MSTTAGERAQCAWRGGGSGGAAGVCGVRCVMFKKVANVGETRQRIIVSAAFGVLNGMCRI